jgi:hypothetical protein
VTDCDRYVRIIRGIWKTGSLTNGASLMCALTVALGI